MATPGAAVLSAAGAPVLPVASAAGAVFDSQPAKLQSRAAAAQQVRMYRITGYCLASSAEAGAGCSFTAFCTAPAALVCGAVVSLALRAASAEGFSRPSRSTWELMGVAVAPPFSLLAAAAVCWSKLSELREPGGTMSSDTLFSGRQSEGSLLQALSDKAVRVRMESASGLVI